jgi:hypothetical protein
MKLYYDKRAKDPIYYVQQGFRNGKKTTTKNVARIGKHSELLKITDDPLTYAKEQVQKYNDELKNNKVSIICCKIKLPNVANAKSRKLQVEIP